MDEYTAIQDTVYIKRTYVEFLCQGELRLHLKKKKRSLLLVENIDKIWNEADQPRSDLWNTLEFKSSCTYDSTATEGRLKAHLRLTVLLDYFIPCSKLSDWCFSFPEADPGAL